MPVAYTDWDRRPAIFGFAPSGKARAYASLDGVSWQPVDAIDVGATAGVLEETDWRARFNPPPFTEDILLFIARATA